MKAHLPVSRREILKSAGVLVASSSVFATPAALAQQTIEDPTFAIAGARDPQLGAQLIVASYFKLFAKVGIDPQIHWHQSAGDVIVTMGSGSIPIGSGSPLAVLVLRSQNVPVKM